MISYDNQQVSFYNSSFYLEKWVDFQFDDGKVKAVSLSSSLKIWKPQRWQETKTQTPTKWSSSNPTFEDGKQMEETLQQSGEKSSQWPQEASQFAPVHALEIETLGTLMKKIIAENEGIFRLSVFGGLQLVCTGLQEPTLLLSHTSSLKSTIVVKFTLQELANSTNQNFCFDFFFQRPSS